MLACVFPGQGSQHLGMLNDWLEHADEVAATLAEASAVLDYDLRALIAEGPAETLNQTEFTQPAMLAADIAIWRAWQARVDTQPAVLAGHSLGEYAALVAGGVLRFEDALRLVQDRARWMQEAVPADQGGMAAIIGLTDDEVIRLCAEVAQDEVLEAVNFNAPGQVVVAGHGRAVQRLLTQARPAGARMAKALPVSVPAHSRLMQPVADALSQRFAELEWQTPRIPVIQNVDAQVHSATADLREALALQVCRPVQWVKTLAAMVSDFDVQTGVECGPGQVLCGLAKRSIKQVPFTALATPASVVAAADR